MSHVKQFCKRSGLLLTAFTLVAALVVGNAVFLPQRAHAAQITTRSLTISSSANGSITTGTAGSGSNGSKTKETFNFTLGTTGTVGSIEYQYCTTPLPGTTCTAPTGMDASTVTSIGGTSATGWTLGTAGNAPTANDIKITHTAASMSGAQNFILGAGGTGTDYIKNPTSDNTTFFVRITTYSDTGWATPVDQGTVASSTAQQVDITAKVQETLNFSVGTTVTAPSTSCTAFSDTGALALGDVNGVLSFTQAYDAHSYFRVSTNAINGTKVYYSGDTLKSGSNSITSIGTTATASAVGSSQFGLGIDSADTQSGSGYSFTSLTRTSPYDQANGTITNAGTAKFAFDTGTVSTPAQIASSSGTITCDTGSVRYLGNVSTTTPPGIYTTTVTYLAVPTY
jgi:hypothetical protein